MIAIIEEAIVEALRKGGPCSFHDFAARVSDFSCRENFAVGEISRHGRLSLCRRGDLPYRISRSTHHAMQPSHALEGDAIDRD